MDDAEHQLAVELQADQGGEVGKTGDEVARAVERIDHPAVALVAFLAVLLAEQAEIRRRTAQRRTSMRRSGQ